MTNKAAQNPLVDELARMTRTLGDPARDCVLPGEGNTSARIDENTFWIKASGTNLAQAEAASFLRVRIDRLLEILNGPTLSVQEMRRQLATAKVDPQAPGSPSIETATHALCFALSEATIIGHTHPTVVNAILCAQDGEVAFSKTIAAAEAVVCGKPLFVPYAPMGQALARAVRDRLWKYTTQFGHPPQVILLQNHGLVALGNTPQQVLDITAMMIKTSRILLGTHAFGGPHFIAE